jgi:cobyrinic acid a,c-diamide synthase
MQIACLPEGEVRAHAHHHSRSENTITPISHAKRATHPAPGEAIYRSKRLTASYLHLFFPSNVNAIIQLFSV